MEEFISNWNYELGNMIGMTFFEPMQFMSMIIRFILNFVVVAIIARGFYFPKSQRRDYMFIFLIMSMSIFMLVNLMGSGDTLNTGAALGLFAIFGIIRYRTEAIPIREMTYLFTIIAVSAINGLTISELSIGEVIIINVLFIAVIVICESKLLISHYSYKVIKYDNINLITPDKREELIAVIAADRRNGENALDQLMIAKYFERIGDHAENFHEIGQEMLGKKIPLTTEEVEALR